MKAISLKLTFLLLVVTGMSYAQESVKNNAISESVTMQDKNITNIKIYPKPVSDILSVQFETEEAGVFVIELYAADGSLAKTIMSSRTVYPGEHTFSMGVGELSNGYYTVSIRSGEFVHSEQVLVSR